MSNGVSSVETEIMGYCGDVGEIQGSNPEIDWKALEQIVASARSEKSREDLMHFVLHRIVGNIKEKELPIFDAKGMLYAFLVSPGYRESLRLLENSNRLKELEKAREDSFVPAEGIRADLKKKYGKS